MSGLLLVADDVSGIAYCIVLVFYNPDTYHVLLMSCDLLHEWLLWPGVCLLFCLHRGKRPSRSPLLTTLDTTLAPPAPLDAVSSFLWIFGEALSILLRSLLPILFDGPGYIHHAPRCKPQGASPFKWRFHTS